MESSAVPNAIAAVLLHIRDLTGKRPHVYFDWTEGNPVAHLLRFLIFGSGEVALHREREAVNPTSNNGPSSTSPELVPEHERRPGRRGTW